METNKMQIIHIAEIVGILLILLILIVVLRKRRKTGKDTKGIEAIMFAAIVAGVGNLLNNSSIVLPWIAETALPKMILYALIAVFLAVTAWGIQFIKEYYVNERAKYRFPVISALIGVLTIFVCIGIYLAYNKMRFNTLYYAIIFGVVIIAIVGAMAYVLPNYLIYRLDSIEKLSKSDISHITASVTAQLVHGTALIGVAVIGVLGVANISFGNIKTAYLNPSVKYSFSEEEGLLRVYGSGDTGDFTKVSPPWCAYQDDILCIEVSAGITRIGDNLFSDCSNAQSVKLSNSVKVIGNHAFSGCGRLEKISLSKNVEEIKATAFDYCSNIKSFSVAQGNKVYFTIKDVLYKRDDNTDRRILVHYPPAKVGDTYTIAPNTYLIATDAFCCCTLKSIIVPDSVESIRDYAFEAYAGDELTIHFSGNAPSFLQSNNNKKEGTKAFTESTATVFYPKQNKTWAKIAKEQPQYGGTVTWKPE